MTTTIALRSRSHAMLPAFAAALAALGLSSCDTLKKSDSGYTEYSGSQPNYPADGRYNPYPQGSVKPAKTSPQYQEYNQPSAGASVSNSQKAVTKPKTTASTTPKKKTAPAASKTTASTKKPATTEKKTSKASSTHIVKPGDSYYSLAKKYHTTVTALKKANNRTSDLLRDGEKLKIP